jgi:hypothetical protein
VRVRKSKTRRTRTIIKFPSLARTIHNLAPDVVEEAIDNPEFQDRARIPLGLLFFLIVVRIIVVGCDTPTVANDNGIAKDNLRMALNTQDFPKQNRCGENMNKR